METLKQSLIEDGSIVPTLSPYEAIRICAIASVLSGTLSKGLEGKNDQDRQKLIHEGATLCKTLNKKFPDRASLIFNILMNLSSSSHSNEVYQYV